MALRIFALASFTMALLQSIPESYLADLPNDETQTPIRRSVGTSKYDVVQSSLNQSLAFTTENTADLTQDDDSSTSAAKNSIDETPKDDETQRDSEPAAEQNSNRSSLNISKPMLNNETSNSNKISLTNSSESILHTNETSDTNAVQYNGPEPAFEFNTTNSTHVLLNNITNCTVTRSEGGVLNQQDFLLLLPDLKQEGYEVAVEVGSFDGTDARNMAQRSNMEVYSFDASLRNHQRCLKNVPKADNPNVTFVHAAITNFNGTIEFLDDGGTEACSDCTLGVNKSAENIQVDAIRLHEASQLQNKLDQVGFLKLDARGHEPDAIEGMLPWFENDDLAPPTIMIRFDVCTMLSSNAHTSRQKIVKMLNSLQLAGYALEDGPVSQHESWNLDYSTMKSNETKDEFDEFDQVRNKPNHEKGLSSVYEANSTLKDDWTVNRPTDCAALVDWYCPPNRTESGPRTHARILAQKHPVRKRTKTL